MYTRDADFSGGLTALRDAVCRALQAVEPVLAAGPAVGAAARSPAAAATGPWLLAEAAGSTATTTAGATGPAGPRPPGGDEEPGSAAEQAESDRVVALVDLARGGDTEAFGLLFDHYHTAVYRFVYYRVGSVATAEDLMSETFFRALRSMSSFRWQGKDFGAWLMTIARNLVTDHYKAGRTRLELSTEDMAAHDSATDGPEKAVLSSMTNQALLEALRELPAEQQECVIMRFLQGMSIAETAKALGRSDGAVKQLQLRGVRNLAKLLPEGVR